MRKKGIVRGQKLSYNAGIENRYKRDILALIHKMTTETTREITMLFTGKIAESYFDKIDDSMAMDATLGSSKTRSLSSKSRILLNQLNKKFELLFSSESKKMANGMVDSTINYSKASLNRSLSQIAKELTIKGNLVTIKNKEVAKSIVTENVSLIESIPEEYFKNITGAVMRSISTGNGLADLVPHMEGVIKKSEKGIKKSGSIEDYNKSVRRRAHLISLDQTRKAYNAINKSELINIGIKQFEWSHSFGGAHPRESHIRIDGHIFSYANLESEQEKLSVPYYDQGLPAFPVNCFPGSTVVSLANGCRNLWRYMYQGEMVSISFNVGQIIECTPNHPVLTLRGWIPANEINEGDYLISCQTDNQGIIDNKKTKITTTFSNLFDSISILGTKVAPCSEFNFHGDVPEVDVDTIVTDDCLPFWDVSISSENIEKFFLTLSDIVGNSFISCFISKIMEPGFSGFMAQKFSFIDGKFRHSDFISDTSISKDDTLALKDSSDILSANFIENRKSEDTFSFVISCNNRRAVRIHSFSFSGDGDDIINFFPQCFGEMSARDFIGFAKFFQSHSFVQKLFRVEKKISSIFEGHVYTMESYNGWYNVSSAEITSKNCRCTQIPVLNFDDL